jgi:hypothetical protein
MKQSNRSKNRLPGASGDGELHAFRYCIVAAIAGTQQPVPLPGRRRRWLRVKQILYR